MKKLCNAWYERISNVFLFLLSVCAAAGICGLAVWFPLHFWMFQSLDWMLCFIGYPAAVMWFLAAFFLMRRSS